MATKNLFLKRDVKEKRALVNIEIDRYLPRKDEYPKQIHKALRHTLFAGGKRIRPYLLVNTYKIFSDENMKEVYKVAGVIEILHSYTLMHDDLPPIDNDDYRRGKKAAHIEHGENIALLAGDGLLVYAFKFLAEIDIDKSIKNQLLKELAQAAGHQGLIAGQIVDIESEGKDVSEKTLKYIHKNKTGKLINLAIRFGCYLANAPEEDRKNLEKYGEKIGLAFQIVDDILDIEGDKETLGKSVGKDKASQKATFPAIYGLQKSREKAKKLLDEAADLLKKYGSKAKTLRMITDYIYTRKF